jgi:hypothetical protein
MLATFCFRLAWGLVGSLLIFSSREVNPRFYRIQFLSAWCLIAAAGVSLRAAWGWWLGLSLAASLGATLLGAIAWSVEGCRGGRVAIILSLGILTGTLAANGVEVSDADLSGALLLDELTSAAVLGTATSAMLMGHSYLITPTMALTPLLRLLSALAICLLARAGMAGAALWFFTTKHSLAILDEPVLWLPLRWGLGLLGPVILGWMARAATQLRATQSATGILYVVVIFCFLGELTSLLLHRETGFYL